MIKNCLKCNKEFNTKNNKKYCSKECANRYKRDDWTCQICGVRGGSLHAHHIKELYKLIEEYPNIEEKYKEDLFGLMDDDYFWNIENGQTCHVKCHYGTYHTKKS